MFTVPTKPSSDDDSGFRHGFGAEASVTQSTPALTHDTTRLCWIDVTVGLSMLMQLEPYLGSFLCISSCLMEKVQD